MREKWMRIVASCVILVAMVSMLGVPQVHASTSKPLSAGSWWSVTGTYHHEVAGPGSGDKYVVDEKYTDKYTVVSNDGSTVVISYSDSGSWSCAATATWVDTCGGQTNQGTYSSSTDYTIDTATLKVTAVSSSESTDEIGHPTWMLLATDVAVGGTALGYWRVPNGDATGSTITDVPFKVDSLKTINVKGVDFNVIVLTYSGQHLGDMWYQSSGEPKVYEEGLRTEAEFYDTVYGIYMGTTATGSYTYAGSGGSWTDATQTTEQITDTNLDLKAATTSITNFQSPVHALLKNGVAQATVKYDVVFSGLSSGYSIVAGIVDLGTSKPVDGSATSAPDSCQSLAGTQYVDSAVCLVIPSSSSGTESVSFSVTFNTAEQYNLRAGASVTDVSSNVVSGSTSKSDFTISVKDKLMLNVTLPSSVTVSIDGANQAPGAVTVSLSPGTHTISVPQTVPLTSGSQLRFDHWSDGSKTVSRTDDLEGDMTLAATYVPQYALSLSEPSATGGGWYDQGSTAQFSVPSSMPASGIMGSLGGTQTLQGWYENGTLVTSSATGSITMNAPHALTAKWASNYTMPIALIAIVAVVVILIAFILMRRRPAKQAPTYQAPPPTVPPATTVARGKFCLNCGAPLPSRATFCKECGTKQQ